VLVPPQLVALLTKHSAKMLKYLNGDFVSLTLQEKKEKVAEVRNISAWAAAGISPLPIPFADIWTITPVQVAMVQAIGNIYGYKLEGANLKAAFGVVAGGWLGQQVCLALFKIGMPGAGGFGGMAFVFCWTHAMAHTAEAYFASGMKASKTELDEARKRGMEEAKKAKRKANEANDDDVLEAAE